MADEAVKVDVKDMDPSLSMQILSAVLTTYGTILAIVSSFFILSMGYSNAKSADAKLRRSFWLFFVGTCVQMAFTLFTMLYISTGTLTGLNLDALMYLIVAASLAVLYGLGSVVRDFLQYYRRT